MEQLLGTFLPIIVIFGLFWFLFIRPQKKRQQEYEDMLSNLARGDKVYTRGGIKGTITKVTEDGLKLRVAPEVNLELRRNGIAEIVDEDDESTEENESEKTEN
jgi:preprotein translocase subunit YajC